MDIIKTQAFAGKLSWKSGICTKSWRPFIRPQTYERAPAMNIYDAAEPTVAAAVNCPAA